MRPVKVALSFLACRGSLVLCGLVIMPLLRLMQSLIDVRISCIQADRIGHLAHDIGSFVVEKLRGSNTKFLIFSPRTANDHVCQVFKEHVTIIENRLIYTILVYCTPAMQFWGVYRQPPYMDAPYRMFNDGPMPLAFPSRLEPAAKASLNRQGVPSEAWFVGFHSRDSRYFQKNFPRANLSYHSYRDTHLSTYLPAAKLVVERGGYAIRMGAPGGDPLPASLPDKVFDYATTAWSPLLDFYFTAKCRFFLANTSGLYAIATVAGRPVAAANMIPLFSVPITRKDLFIPKRLRRKSDGKLLNFHEVMDIGAGDFFRTEQYQDAGIEVIDNTEEEIADLCREMFDRLEGRPIPEPAKSMQKSFLEFVHRAKPELEGCADISYKFLERHPYLLEQLR